MKTAFFGLGLAAIAASANAIDYEVASCAELADIDDTTVTSLTITSSDFACDSYTRFRVRNDITLKSDSDVVFSNFALKVLGTLTVEPNVTFQDVVEEETHGGALYVDKGSSATFQGTASFAGNSVISTDLPSIPVGSNGYRMQYKIRNGGAVFNKGALVFEGDAAFYQNEAATTDSTNVAKGGAIYNARIGSIAFNGGLTANGNNADGFFEGDGGAIFNAGDIVVEGASSFTDNTAADGGAIYIHPTGTLTFNHYANFTDNTCFEHRGAAIFNSGSVDILGGSLFLNNVASSSGDGGDGGGIYNADEGSLTFGGDNTFDGNWAFRGGAIYNDIDASISSPADSSELIFENLRGEFCPGIYYRAEITADHTCGP